MLLSVDLSDRLLELLYHRPTLVDAVEVGPWYTLEQISQYRQVLPGLPFYFHGRNMAVDTGCVPGAARKMRAYLQCTGSPWISLHISTCQAWMLRWAKLGWCMPALNPEQSRNRFVLRILELKRLLGVLILLENMDPLPWLGFEFQLQPGFITSVVVGSDSSLLLDTGHVRVSAEYLGMGPIEYLSRLPLERVLQVHVSGPRQQGDHLKDAHETLQEADYELLNYVLRRTHPRIVTLEYINEVDALESQLVRLRKIVESCS